MKRIAVTQRVVVERGERRDCLDQRWYAFLEACGLLPVVLPNDLALATRILAEVPVSAVLLTGGNDLADLGGEAPERDALEQVLVDKSLRSKTPLIGVCRGMQVIHQALGAKLQRVPGHVTPALEITVHGKPRTVNSYHEWGTRQQLPVLETWATAPDGIIKAVKHRSAPMVGIMWHPERNPIADNDDLRLFTQLILNSTETKAA